jgi:hypothetical protein
MGRITRMMERGLRRTASQFGLYRTFRHQIRQTDVQELERLIRTRGLYRQALVDIYNQMLLLSYDRDRLYLDYESILEDSVAASALEIMVDDAIPYNKDRGVSVWVESDNDANIADAMNKRLLELNIEHAIWDWAFTTGLYGDFFLKLHVKEGEGVTSYDDTRHPIDTERVDINGRLVAYRDMVMPEGAQFTGPFAFIHFRILAAYKRRRAIDLQPNALNAWDPETHRYRLTSKYGVSLLANARRPWIQLTAMENAMILNRMARHPRVVYTLHLGDEAIPPKIAQQYVDLYQELLFKNRAVSHDSSGQDSSGAYLGTYPDDLAMGEDVVIPTSHGQTLTPTEIGKEFNVRGIEDINYLRQKYHGALKVPKAFLGVEESLPGGIGDNSLLYIATRYARTVKRLQRATTDGVKRLLMIDYLLRHPGKVLPPDSFRVVTDLASTAEDLERRQAQQSVVTMIGGLADVADRLGEKGRLNTKKIMEYAVREIFPVLPLEEIYIRDDAEAEEATEKKLAVAPPLGGAAPAAGAPGADGRPVPGRAGQAQAGQASPVQPKAMPGTSGKVESLRERYTPPNDPDLDVIMAEMRRYQRLQDGRQRRGSKPIGLPPLAGNARRRIEMVVKREKDERAARREAEVAEARAKIRSRVMGDYGLSESDAEFLMSVADSTAGGAVRIDHLPEDQQRRLLDLMPKLKMGAK